MIRDIMQLEDLTRWDAPPDTPDAHTEGWAAWYALSPTPDNYLDIFPSCPYPQETILHEVFYEGVQAAEKHFSKNL